jgi:hypothetical protein
MVLVLRASQIYSRPGKPGRLPTGKSHFYELIEPQLERVVLGPMAVGYTERSLDKLIERGIVKAAAERRVRLPRIRTAKRGIKAAAAEVR